ncbi:GPR1/FUN34/yaaH family-domain-containing protein [Leucosporidium creatinivorum]|uniref:GPR1/FUN34/yaaH family-domain-containing protein n=1 Tax=Leucosporidium creatinivorum TaxID=106004 RepID=A0A1Y2FZM9_9BASI|nr:GPR1/FUN34/yaaH family-domain-containing protein [Leucosporidium creatinivorum]
MPLTAQDLDKSTSHPHTEAGAETLHDTHHHQPPIQQHQIYQSTTQPFFPVYHGSKFANPSPLALFALASGLYITSQVALGTGGLANLSITVTIGLGYSAVALLIAGIWEFPSGNPFASALFVSLSGFFASLALVLSPWSDVSTSYTNAAEFPVAVSQFFFAWFITVFCFIVAAHRSSGGLLIALSLIDLTLLFFGLSYRYPSTTGPLTAGGSFGIIAAFVCWYAALASLLTEESSLFRLPVLGNFSKKQHSA